MNETYTLRIERRGNEMRISEGTIPDDAFGRKMLCILLYQLAEHIDPAFRDGIEHTNFELKIGEEVTGGDGE